MKDSNKQVCCYGSNDDDKSYNFLRYDTCCAFSNINVDSEGFVFESGLPIGIKRITAPFGNLTFSPKAQSIDALVAALNLNNYGSLNWYKDGCKLKTKVLKSESLPSSLEFTGYQVHKYSLYVLFANSNSPVYSSFSDATDLTSFNSAQRTISTGALHYVNWFEINGQEILGHQNLASDTFRMEFQDVSAGNRGELDFIGSTSANAKSWAKNYCNFINSKLVSNNISGVQYFIPSSEVITNNTNYTKFSYDFYVILEPQSSLTNVQISSYTIDENLVSTNWAFNPHDDQHEFAVSVDSNLEVEITPSVNGSGGSSNYICNIKI